METTTNNSFEENGDNPHSSGAFLPLEEAQKKFLEWEQQITALSSRLDSLDRQAKEIKKNEDLVTQFQASVNDIHAMMEESLTKTTKTQESWARIEKKQKRLSDRFKKLEKREKEQTRNNIEILGLFITFFTFISVSVSIILQLKTVFHAAFVLMVLLTGLMVFLYFFHHLLHHEHKPLEKIPYKQGESRFITFIKYQWCAGNMCYMIPAILAILCGIVAWLFGPETFKEKEPANINYIQNMPTSKIRLDENVEQYNTSPASVLPKPPMNSSVAK